MTRRFLEIGVAAYGRFLDKRGWIDAFGRLSSPPRYVRSPVLRLGLRLGF